MAERTLTTRYGFTMKDYYYIDIPKAEWISVMVVSSITIAVGISLLVKETHRRTSTNNWFSFSYLMMIYPPLIGLVHLLSFPPGICIVARNIGELFIWLQMFDFLCILIFKLKASIPEQNAYPQWMYAILYCLSTVWVIAEILTWNVFLVTTSCGIKDGGEAFFNLKVAEFLGDDYMVGVSGLLINLFGLCLLTLWIVILYEWKLKSIATDHDQALLEMNRVLVITYFVTISSIWINAIRILFDGTGPILGLTHTSTYAFADCAPGLVYGFGTMLIQKHNDAEYMVFLKVVEETKMYLCCCCCYQKARRQYQEMAKSKRGDLDAKPEMQLSDVVNA